ncbi:MAG: 1,3-beta-galactosyl-N-acetylhexosamine phosphorylase N-terminal domain-containing protein, partial [Suipraeoptans sp.]
MSELKGGFTLPGESGYEELTLKMARKWGADVIRDSDGTELSPEIIESGYGIYSTICIIRDHNEWASQNKNKLQQTFLATQPIVAIESVLKVELMKDFFKEQFKVNGSKESIRYWQVYDRTTQEEVEKSKWRYDASSETVIIEGIELYHSYTVSFMTYRIWEEISMYNHVTNDWDKEHLMQIDPIHMATQEYLIEWMIKWCETHPHTTVVRFTSLFYNFSWIWGSNDRNRNLFTDWGSYDFAVSPKALSQFEEKYG